MGLFGTSKKELLRRIEKLEQNKVSHGVYVNLVNHVTTLETKVENNRKSVSRANSRITAYKRHVKSTFGFLANEKSVDGSSNSQVAKWLEDEL